MSVVETPFVVVGSTRMLGVSMVTTHGRRSPQPRHLPFTLAPLHCSPDHRSKRSVHNVYQQRPQASIAAFVQSTPSRVVNPS